MGKYDKFHPTARSRERPWKIHPIWRGIGCITMVLIPIMAYAGSILLVEENMRRGWLPTPPEMARAIFIPYIGAVPHLLANILVTVILSLIGFGLLVTFYSIMFSLSGGSKYGPLDAPPPERRARRR